MNQLQQAKKAQGLKKFYSDLGSEQHAKHIDFLQNGCVKTFVTLVYGGNK